MRTRYNKTLDELWCTPTNLDAARGPDWSGCVCCFLHFSLVIVALFLFRFFFIFTAALLFLLAALHFLVTINISHHYNMCTVPLSTLTTHHHLQH